MAEGRCKTCHSWVAISNGRYGLCTDQRLTDHPSMSPALSGAYRVEPHLDGLTFANGGLHTGPEFGCVQYREKHEIEVRDG